MTEISSPQAGGCTPAIDAEMIRAALTYDRHSGTFARIGGRRSSRPLGSLVRGYRRIEIHGRAYRAHVLAWVYVHGAVPDGLLDHINGNRDDNRIQNLRIADKQQNGANMRARRDDMPKGVRPYRRKFQAYIKVSRRFICIGYYSTADEAAHAYNKAAITHFGEFACLNPVGTK